MLVEGLACVFHGERVTGTGALARGARVRVGDAPPRAPALDSRFRGNDDGGVGARGSCQGGGCTAPRPCPGFPLSRERRWGNWREGSCQAPLPWGGMHRPAPLPWIPAFAGTTMGALARVRVGDAPPRAPALDSGTTMGECGFGREGRRTDLGARGMRWDLSGLLGCGIIARAARWVFGARLCMRAREEGAPPQANSRRHLPFFPIGMVGQGAQRCCRPRARRDDERCQIPHPHGTAYPLPRPRGVRRTGSGRWPRRVGSQLLTRRSPRPA